MEYSLLEYASALDERDKKDKAKRNLQENEKSS